MSNTSRSAPSFNILLAIVSLAVIVAIQLLQESPLLMATTSAAKDDGSKGHVVGDLLARAKAGFASGKAESEEEPVEEGEETNDDVSEEDRVKSDTAAISAYRTLLEQQCENSTMTPKDYRTSFSKIYEPDPQLKYEEDSPRTTVHSCPYVFLDFGANIGDSLGKFIDSGFHFCQPKNLGFPKYSLSSGRMDELYLKGWNDLASYAQKNRMVEPEHYCYVGVEGNPVFTDRLKKLEWTVAHTSPRPVRSARFYTESIAVANDGPAVLYLDTVNTRHNFWGSSVFDSHWDVTKSAKQNNNTKVEAHVQGISLTTLLNRTVDSSTKHVLIKMDIEGAEYQVLKQAQQKICGVIASGVKISMLLETHPVKMLGTMDPITEFNQKTLPALKTCGLNVNTGSGGRR